MKTKLLAHGTVGMALTVATAYSASPPNILFIASDDMRPELGCYGVSRAKTLALTVWPRLVEAGQQWNFNLHQ